MRIRAKKKVSASLAYKQRAPIGIGKTRRQIKAKKESAEQRQIRETHDKVWTRDLACRVTGIASDEDQMHEDPSRAQTRGMPPEVRFNTRVCVRLSPRIHQLVTEHKITLFKLDPMNGFDGTIAWSAYQDILAGCGTHRGFHLFQSLIHAEKK